MKKGGQTLYTGIMKTKTYKVASEITITFKFTMTEWIKAETYSDAENGVLCYHNDACCSTLESLFENSINVDEHRKVEILECEEVSE